MKNIQKFREKNNYANWVRFGLAAINEHLRSSRRSRRGEYLLVISWLSPDRSRFALIDAVRTIKNRTINNFGLAAACHQVPHIVYLLELRTFCSVSAVYEPIKYYLVKYIIVDNRRAAPLWLMPKPNCARLCFARSLALSRQGLHTFFFFVGWLSYRRYR